MKFRYAATLWCHLQPFDDLPNNSNKYYKAGTKCRGKAFFLKSVLAKFSNPRIPSLIARSSQLIKQTGNSPIIAFCWVKPTEKVSWTGPFDQKKTIGRIQLEASTPPINFLPAKHQDDYSTSYFYTTTLAQYKAAQGNKTAFQEPS